MNNTVSLHKSLNLPSTYRTKTSISGHVRVGDSYHEQRLIDLRFLITDTLGMNPAYALKVVNGKGIWESISQEQFKTLALAIINGERLEAKDEEIVTK